MRHSRVAVLAVILLLAGCLGGGSPTATDTGNRTAAADGTVPSADTVRSQTLQAMSEVDAYVAVQHVTTVRNGDGQNRTTVQVEYTVNRTTHALNATRRTTRGRTRVVDRYVVNETLYQRSDAFLEQYDSEWIRRDVSDGFDRQWKLFDQLWRYRFMLDSASLSPVETTTLGGEDVYVLRASVDTVEMNAALREALDLPPQTGQTVDPNMNLTATFWIDTETYRPLRVERTLSGTQTVEGETVPFERDINSTFAYRNVSVSLPSGADGAQSVGTN